MHTETLLCELHAHTTSSDGELTVAQLVDLYGAAGFDPYTPAQVDEAPRGTARWAAEPEWAAASVDRFELFNRHDRFDWVAGKQAPGRRDRRLPPRGAPPHLEDADRLRARGGGRGRAPAFCAPGRTDPLRARAARRVAACSSSGGRSR